MFTDDSLDVVNVFSEETRQVLDTSDALTQTGSELMPETAEISTASVDLAEIQTQTSGIRYTPGHIDELAVGKFLSAVVPVMMRELVPCTAYRYLETKTTTTSFEPFIQYTVNDSYSVSSMSCNSNGSTVAVAVEHSNHTGWCNHQSVLSFFSLYTDSTLHTFNLDSCLSCVKFHPVYPSIVAIGHHTGEISVLKNEDKWAITRLGETHLDKIVALEWVAEEKSINTLLSASVSGLICFWNLKSRNSKTKLLTATRTMQTASISSLSSIPGSKDILIGHESGEITDSKRKFRGHLGPVKLTVCSEFPNVFCSIGTDRTICVHNRLNQEPLVTYQTDYDLYDIAFCPKLPSIIAVATYTGVDIIDISVSLGIPVYHFDEEHASTVEWSPSSSDTLIVGCTDGRVRVLIAKDGSFEANPAAKMFMSKMEVKIV